MLPEPELLLVVRYLMGGGEIKEIPFGVSGYSWSFGKTARKSGSWGAFRRYGGLHIEPAALPYIAAGNLNPAQARVGLVWSLLRQHGPVSAGELADKLGLSARTVRATLIALTETGAVNLMVIRIKTGIHKFAAVERAQPPHWTDYLQPQAAAA